MDLRGKQSVAAQADSAEKVLSNHPENKANASMAKCLISLRFLFATQNQPDQTTKNSGARQNGLIHRVGHYGCPASSIATRVWLRKNKSHFLELRIC